MTIKICYLLLCCLLMIFGGSGHLAAQANAEISITTPNWNWESLPCDICGYTNIDQNNTLYMLDNRTHILTILKADGTPGIQIDLKQTAPEVAVYPWYFIPFEDATLVFGTYTQNGYRLFLYDLETQAVAPISISGKPILCNAFPTIYAKGIYRIGKSKQFVACSVNTKEQQELIHIVDLDTSTDTIVEFGAYDMTSGSSVLAQGGLDGYLYVQTNLLAYSSDDSFAILRRYRPDLDTWQDIPILRSWLARIPDDAFIVSAYIQGINESGHLYYKVQWIDNHSEHHSDLLKIVPNGDLIWHLTEAELESVDLFIELLPNDTFLVLHQSGARFLMQFDDGN